MCLIQLSSREGDTGERYRSETLSSEHRFSGWPFLWSKEPKGKSGVWVRIEVGWQWKAPSLLLPFPFQRMRQSLAEKRGMKRDMRRDGMVF